MNQLFNGECMKIMAEIPDKSIDMIFADLPYGTTQNEFDKQLPLTDYVMVGGKALNQEQYLLHAYRAGVPYKDALAAFHKEAVPGLWTHYKRIIKDNGCIALFAQAPFDIKLANSNQSWYRYEWIIQKTRPTGHLNARRAPLKAHEKVLIFYKKPPTCNLDLKGQLSMRKDFEKIGHQHRFHPHFYPIFKSSNLKKDNF